MEQDIALNLAVKVTSYMVDSQFQKDIANHTIPRILNGAKDPMDTDIAFSSHQAISFCGRVVRSTINSVSTFSPPIIHGDEAVTAPFTVFSLRQMALQ